MAKKQWFRPVVYCNYYSRSATFSRRKPLDDVLGRVQEKYQNFYVLDLMETMCPTGDCKMFDRSGIFLYRDESSHPSVEANILAQGLLLSLAKQVIATSVSAVGSSSIKR